jgi:hypothetical protein
MEDTVLIDARVRLLVSAAAVILFANAAPERVAAQSSLDVAQASEFLGSSSSVNGENLDAFLELGMGQTAQGVGTGAQR